MRRLLWLALLLLTALPFLTAAGLAVRSAWRIDRWDFYRWSLPSGTGLRNELGYQVISYSSRIVLIRETTTGAKGAVSVTPYVGTGLHTGHESSVSKGRMQISDLLAYQRAVRKQYTGFNEHLDVLGLQSYSTTIEYDVTNPTNHIKRQEDVTVLPIWWSLPLLSLPPVLTLWLHRRATRRRLIREGRCVGCGYDLRGSPGRCPECGRAAERLQSSHHGQ